MKTNKKKYKYMMTFVQALNKRYVEHGSFFMRKWLSRDEQKHRTKFVYLSFSFGYWSFFSH